MNHFRLFAHGEAFDPDAYLASASLEFDGVWHKGEITSSHPKSSGIFKELGDGWSMPLREQERVALEYLVDNRDALKDLAQHPDVTTFILGLHYVVDLDECIVAFALGASRSLALRCLDIGISLTFYVSLGRSFGEEWVDA